MKPRLYWLVLTLTYLGWSTAASAFTGEVVIGEIAWAGPESNAVGEWIELYNTTSAPIDLSGWTLTAASGAPRIALSGTLAPCSYFLLEREGAAFGDITADQIYSGELEDGGDALLLRDKSGQLVDSANRDGGPWPGGKASGLSMERINPFSPDDDGNWSTNDGTTTNGLDIDGRRLNATPGSRNASFAAPPIVARLVAEPDLAVPGGTITYRVIITNTGDSDIANLSFNGTVDANTTLDPSSLKTTPLALSRAVRADPDAPLLLTLMGLDPDGDDLRFDIVEAPLNGTLGTLTQMPPNSALVTYTPKAGFLGFDRIRFAVDDGTGSTCEAILNISIGAAPIAVDDTYEASGNITIAVDVATGVHVNDEGSQIAVVQVQSAAANIGVPTPTEATGLNGAPGLVTMEADGSFTYEPAPGFVGDDTFTYAIDNGFSTASKATVTISVSAMVWFVDAAASGANSGTIADPFQNIAAFNAAQGSAAPNAKQGDLIYLFAGAYTDGIVLQNDQTLLGQAVDITDVFTAASNSAPPYPPAPGARPLLSTNLGNGILLAQNNTVRGLDIGNTPDGFGIADNGSSSGALAIDRVAISGTGGAIRIATDGELAVDFDQLVSNDSPGAGIRVEGGSGTFAVGAATTINGARAEGIEIVNSTARFNFAEVVIDNRNASGIWIANAAGSAIEFGPTTIPNPNAAPGYGIRIEASSAPIIIASAQISSTTRSADETANQANRQIPTDDGDGDGIFLKDNSGRFTLGGPSTIAASGDNGIDMRNAIDVRLDQVVIDGSQDSGIQGIAVAGFTFTNSQIINFGDDISSALPPVNDSGMWFRDLSGTVVISGSTIGPDAHFAATPFPPAIANDGIEIWNDGADALDLALTGTELNNISNDGIDIRAQGGDVALRVDGRISPNTFAQTNGRALNLEHAGDRTDNGLLDLLVHSTTFANVGIGARLSVAGGGEGKMRVDDNTMTVLSGDAVRLLGDPNDALLATTVDARVQGNACGGGGALIASRRGAEIRLALHNNTAIGGQGIIAESSRQSTLETTFAENQVAVNTAAPDFALAAFFLQVANPSLEAATACVDLNSNALEAVAGLADPVAFDQSGTSAIRLAGWGGGDNASAASFVDFSNTLLGGISSPAVSVFAGSISAGPSACSGPAF